MSIKTETSQPSSAEDVEEWLRETLLLAEELHNKLENIKIDKLLKNFKEERGNVKCIEK